MRIIISNLNITSCQQIENLSLLITFVFKLTFFWALNLVYSTPSAHKRHKTVYCINKIFKAQIFFFLINFYFVTNRNFILPNDVHRRISYLIKHSTRNWFEWFSKSYFDETWVWRYIKIEWNELNFFVITYLDTLYILIYSKWGWFFEILSYLSTSTRFLHISSRFDFKICVASTS